MTFKIKQKILQDEIAAVLEKVNEAQVEKFTKLFLDKSDKKIVIAGAGRMGYAAKGFAMRLGHMGYAAWMLGDSTVPHIGNGDLLVVTSGSGNTQTIYDITVRAHENGAQIALITNNPNSRIGKLASTILVLPNNNNKDTKEDRVSVQPMTTLNEQCLALMLDAIVLMLMDKTGETHDTMWDRHSNLE